MSALPLPRGLLARCAVNFPDKIAYWCGEEARSWAQMHERAMRLASALIGLGVRKGDSVAILSGESIRIYEHFFACMQMGAVRLGLNIHYTAEEIVHVLTESSVRVLLVESGKLPLAPKVQEFIKAGNILVVGCGAGHGLATDFEAIIATAPARAHWPDIALGDPLLCTYTSGTTGQPKGVLHHHEGVAQMIFQSLVSRGLGPDDVWCTAAASSWMTVVLNVLGLGNGMGHVVMDGEFAMVSFLRDMERRRVSTVMLVPTLIRRAIDEVRKGGYDLSALRLLMYGSAPAEPQLIRNAFTTFGCEMVQSYGMTEAGWLTQLSAADHRFALAHQPGLLRSVGRPGVLCEVSVRDEHGQPLPTATLGNVWVRGPMMMLGYVNRAQESAEALRDDWLVTHDVGRLDERGYLFLTDRRKFLIISGGVNIFPSGIEAVLADHVDIEAAAVVGVPHPDWGEAVVAVIKLRDARTRPSTLALQEFCMGRLKREERPKHFFFVDVLPRSSTGKLQKNNIREWVLARAADLPWNADGFGASR